MTVLHASEEVAVHPSLKKLRSSHDRARLSQPGGCRAGLGIKPATLRRLCRRTGICTRLERGRITLDSDDIAAMRAHIEKHGTRPASEPDGVDYFAEGASGNQ